MARPAQKNGTFLMKIFCVYFCIFVYFFNDDRKHVTINVTAITAITPVSTTETIFIFYPGS